MERLITRKFLIKFPFFLKYFNYKLLINFIILYLFINSFIKDYYYYYFAFNLNNLFANLYFIINYNFIIIINFNCFTSYLNLIINFTTKFIIEFINNFIINFKLNYYYLNEKYYF